MDSFSKNIAAIRQDYSLSALEEIETGDNPVLFFKKWFAEAEKSDCMEVNAMTLATVDAQGRPHARVVLLKGLEEDQFVFYTNYASHKGQQIEANENVALLFFWPELQRQVRVEGSLQKVSALQSDAYFSSRPQGSQLGAIASPQSQKIANRQVLEHRLENIDVSNGIQRPETWGGFALNPNYIEFWQGRSSRLHDRIVFEKKDTSWEKYRLAP